MSSFLKSAFTGKDNSSADIGRILWAAAFAVFLGLAIAEAVKTGTFDMMAYAAATGAMLASGGIGLKIKASTEPGS